MSSEPRRKRAKVGTAEAGDASHASRDDQSGSEMTTTGSSDRALLRQLLAQLRQQQAVVSDLAARLEPGNAKSSKIIPYVLCGHGGPEVSGRLPKHLLQTEPNSALATMFNGDWEDITDEQGRVVITCRPEHWGHIIDWLDVRIVPKDPSDDFMKVLNFWGFEGLLAAIEAARQHAQQQESRRLEAKAAAESSRLEAKRQEELREANKLKWTVSVELAAGKESSGFKARLCISDFRRLFQTAADENRCLDMPFSACGRDWQLLISAGEFGISLLSGGDLIGTETILNLGSSGLISVKIEELHPYRAPDTENGYGPSRPTGRGLNEEDIFILTHPRSYQADGCLAVEVQVLLWHDNF